MVEAVVGVPCWASGQLSSCNLPRRENQCVPHPAVRGGARPQQSQWSWVKTHRSFPGFVARCGDFLLEAVVLPPHPCHGEGESPSWSEEEEGRSLCTASENWELLGFRVAHWGNGRKLASQGIDRGRQGAGRSPESSWLAGLEVAEHQRDGEGWRGLE